MKTCPEIKPYVQGNLSPSQAAALKQHLAVCPQCARRVRLVRLGHRLLQATLPAEASAELPADFLVKLAAGRRQLLAGEKWVFWESVWSFSKPFAVVAMVLLLLISGLNLYTVSPEISEPLLVENYLVEPSSDDIDLILSEDLALTQERVLGTLVVVKEDDNGNR